MALGTAYYLSQHPERFAGTVKFIFQPAEEGPGGAEPMIREFIGCCKTLSVRSIARLADGNG
ncbi:M20/M25/M40 family metallo-hydrolase [Leptolyngbya ohadii]|uniref:M20/M25/M40 family metallo-hydrolase n=1 Tax=Leptolyngbya ohadii TaxID=1962290 RepID=UPI0034E1D85F